jgi:hypothetical protein
MSYSPWGKIQNKLDIAAGIKFVSTAGHGGLMISEKLAIKNLPQIALKEGILYSGYYCFEEDCAYAIPVFIMDIPLLPNANHSIAEKTVKNWYPDIYEAFTKIKLNLEDSWMLRKRKHIEDIKDKMVAVAASSTTNNMVIVTACKGGRDENGNYKGKCFEYLVSSEDYSRRSKYEFTDFIFDHGDYECLSLPST